jgi:histidine triad (HIT) family protein
VSDCLFCRIIAGDVPAEIVFESDTSVAFLDHRPVFEGHTLVVPRAHVVTLRDLPAELLTPYFTDLQHIVAGVEDALEAHGSFVAVNNVVSQSVAHLHFHVVPRRRKDGLRGFFWPRSKYESDQAMAAVAARIRERLQRG